MKSINLILMFVLIICWSLSPLVKKQSIGDLTKNEHAVISTIITLLMIMFYYLHQYQNGREDNIAHIMYKITTKQICWLLLSSFIISISGTIITFGLKNNDILNIIPQVQPCVIILTILINYMFFDGVVTKNEIIGTMFIIVGLIMFNITDLKKLIFKV
jgi:uncharacterized membrane protein